MKISYLFKTIISIKRNIYVENKSRSGQNIRRFCLKEELPILQAKSGCI